MTNVARDNQLMLIGRVLENPELLKEYDFSLFDLEFQTILIAMESRVSKNTACDKQGAATLWFKNRFLTWGKSLKSELTGWLIAHAARRAMMAKMARLRLKTVGIAKDVTAIQDPREFMEKHGKSGFDRIEE